MKPKSKIEITKAILAIPTKGCQVVLKYKHARNLFIGSEWKPFVLKYFTGVKFLGCECGNWYPSISVDNWNEVKDLLPKSYQPMDIEFRPIANKSEL